MKKIIMSVVFACFFLFNSHAWSLSNNPVNILHSFKSPKGTQPSGLTWFGGYLWMSSYKLNPGIYKIDTKTGKLEEKWTPPIVWDNRYGGLASDQYRIYHLQANNGRKMTLIRPHELSVINSYEIKASGINYSDIAVVGDYIWVIGSINATDPEGYRLLKINKNNGNVVNFFKVHQGDKIQQNFGLAFDGFNLWGSAGDKLFLINMDNGLIEKKFSLPFSRVESLAFDGFNLWGASFHGDIFVFSVPE